MNGINQSLIIKEINQQSICRPVDTHVVMQLVPSGCSSRDSSEEYDDDDDFKSTSSTVEVTLPMKMFANRKTSLCKRDIDICRYDRICTLGKQIMRILLNHL